MGILQTLTAYLKPTPVFTPTASQQSRAITKALHDPEFRQDLLTDPKAALRSLKIPVLEQQNITVLEGGHGHSFFVLPLMTDAEVKQLQASLNTDLPQRVIRAKVLLQAWQDPDYKAQLLEDPKATLIAAGMKIPTTAIVTVLENSLEHVYLVLPHIH